MTILKPVLFLLGVGCAGNVPFATAHSQGSRPDGRVLGTWTGPVHCLHAGGDTCTMSITRDASGTLTGTMDWALVGSDGRKGPAIPFTSLTVDGDTLTATATADERTAQLEARVEGATITGKWWVKDVSDTWTFTGQKQ